MADRISYAAICKKVADDGAEVAVGWRRANFETSELDAQVAAFRELAALCERATEIDSGKSLEQASDLCHQLAAGFDPQRAGAREGRSSG